MRLQPIVNLPLAPNLSPADQLLVVKNGVVCLGTVSQLTGLSAIDLTVSTLTVTTQATVNGPIYLRNPTGIGESTSLYRTSTTFNGTVDQGTFIGYNTRLFGQITDAALGSVMIGMEDNYNDGVNIYTEYHVNLAKPGGSYVRPFAAYMNRSTGVMSTSVLASTQIDLFATDLINTTATEIRTTNGDAIGPRLSLISTGVGGKNWQLYSTGPSATGGAGLLSVFNNTNSRMGFSLYGQASAGMSLSVAAAAINNNDASSLLQLGEGGDAAGTRTNIRWRNGGIAVPSSENALSNGDKAVLWNSSNIKLAIGVDNGQMWFQNSGTGATAGFKFFAGTSGSPAPEFVIGTNHTSIVNYWVLHGRSTTNNPIFGVNGSDSNISTGFVSKGTGRHAFYTAGTWNSDNVTTGGNEQFRITDTASAVNMVAVTGNSTTGAPAVYSFGTDTNVGLKFVTQGTGTLSFQTNVASPVEQVQITHTANAVNQVGLTGDSTGGAPAIYAIGETNVGLKMIAKGNGGIAFQTNVASPVQQAFVAHVSSAVNYINMHGRATTGNPVIGANGSDTNINLAVLSKGTGAIGFYTGGAWDAQGVVSAGNEQARVLDTASANRFVTLTGSNGGNPVLSVSAGALALGAAGTDIQWLRTNIALGGGAAPTVGTIGGSGPAAAAQRNWLRFIESDGTASFIPVWR